MNSWKIFLLACCGWFLAGCGKGADTENPRSVVDRGVDAAPDISTTAPGGQSGSGNGGGGSGGRGGSDPSDAGRELEGGGGSGATSGGAPNPEPVPAPSGSAAGPTPNIIPGEWRCTVLTYRDGVCDCGCGTTDPDCPSDDIDDCERCDARESCAMGSCPTSIDPEDTTTCLGVPARWACSDADYFDDDCDCGCGTADPSCADEQLGSCDTCNPSGGCSTLACPGAIDPDNTTQCVELPEGWTCNVAEYFDEDCDCGCGVIDPNCADNELTSCDDCDPSGGCSRGSCPGAIDPADATTCYVPEGWTCLPALYGDNQCHCGCAVLDIDCESSSADACNVCSSGCSNEYCPGPIDSNDNTICTGPPRTWNCDRRFFGDGALCHCGCGAIDPDCETEAIESCDRCDFEGSCSTLTCPGSIDPDDIAHCVVLPAPDDWTCPAYRYADGYCDCGCGAVDIDCTDATIDGCEVCVGCSSACPGLVDPADTTLCLPRPEEWRCDGFMYADGFNCDCGCGVVDPDCEDATSASCDYCSQYSGSCSLNYCMDIRPEDNAHCVGEAPTEWICDPATYNDEACDCGCGAVDVDCASAESECDLCNAPGSCAEGDCASIDPANNAACLP